MGSDNSSVKESENVEELVRELFRLIDKKEESDSGKIFNPNRLELSSCRVLDAKKIQYIMRRLRLLVK